MNTSKATETFVLALDRDYFCTIAAEKGESVQGFTSSHAP